MAKYRVRYYECYEGYYEVEAKTKEEAEDIVQRDIYEGGENAPEDCYESGCTTKLLESEVE